MSSPSSSARTVFAPTTAATAPANTPFAYFI
jgi:hypothetical protein